MKVSSIPIVNPKEESVLTRHNESIAMINAALNIKREDGYVYSRALLSPDMPASIVEQDLGYGGVLTSVPVFKQQSLADYFKYEDKLKSVLQVVMRFVPKRKSTNDELEVLKIKSLKKYINNVAETGKSQWRVLLYPKELDAVNIDEQFLHKQSVFRDLIVLNSLQNAVHNTKHHPPKCDHCNSSPDCPLIPKPSSSGVIALTLEEVLLMSPLKCAEYAKGVNDETIAALFNSLFVEQSRVSVSGISFADFKSINEQYKLRKKDQTKEGKTYKPATWSRSELQCDYESHQQLWCNHLETSEVYFCCGCNDVKGADGNKCNCSERLSSSEPLSEVVLELSVSSAGSALPSHQYNLKVRLRDGTGIHYTSLAVCSCAPPGENSHQTTIHLNVYLLLHAYFTRFSLLQSEVLFLVFHLLDHFGTTSSSSSTVAGVCEPAGDDLDFLDLISLSDLECTLGSLPVESGSGVTGYSGSSGCSPDNSVISAVVQVGASLERRYASSIPAAAAAAAEHTITKAEVHVIENDVEEEDVGDAELDALLRDLEEDGNEPLLLMQSKSTLLVSDASSVSDNEQRNSPTKSKPSGASQTSTSNSYDSKFVTLMHDKRIIAGCQFDLNLSSQLQNLAPGGKTREFVVNLMKMWLNFGRDNVLKLCRGYVSGVTLPCLHMVGLGAWTGPREESCRLHQVDVNLGPAVCQWFAVEGVHVQAFSSFMMTKYNLDVLAQNGNWFPSIQMMSEANIPFLHGFQRPGCVMSIQGNTLSWKRSLGFAQHLCWTVGYLEYEQIAAIVAKNQLSMELSMRGMPLPSTVTIQTLLMDVLQILRHMRSKVKPVDKVMVQKEKNLFLDQCKLSKFVLRQVLEKPALLSQLLLFLFRNVFRFTKLTEVVQRCCKIKPVVDTTWQVTHCCRVDCQQEVFEGYVHCDACGIVCLSCALRRCDRYRYQCEVEWNGYFAAEVDKAVPIVERIGGYRMRHCEKAVLRYKGFEGESLEDKLAALHKLFSDLKEYLSSELYRTSRNAEEKEKCFRDNMSRVKKEVGKELNYMFGMLLAGRLK